MPDNYHNRRSESLFKDQGNNSKRQRLAYGRQQAELGVNKKEREREAQRMIQAMEAERSKKEREALMDPDKFVKRMKSVAMEKESVAMEKEEEQPDLSELEDFLLPQYNCTVYDNENRAYPSLEHAFQAQKCEKESDREAIQGMSWRDAKSFGAKALKKQSKQGKNIYGKLLESLRQQFLAGQRQSLLRAWLEDRLSESINDAEISWLVSWLQKTEEREIRLNNTMSFTLGRDADITIHHASCSRLHAALYSISNQAYIVDLDSARGTFYRIQHHASWQRLPPFQPLLLSAQHSFRFADAPKQWSFRLLSHAAARDHQQNTSLTASLEDHQDDDDQVLLLKMKQASPSFGVLVTNLSYQATEADLRKSDLLKDVTVLKVHIDRGQALIDVASDRDLSRLACDDDQIMGRRVRVSKKAAFST